MKSKRVAKSKAAKRSAPAKMEAAVPSPSKAIVPEQRSIKR